MFDAAVVLFNGVAYGMLLFIITVGLSLTMGMMRFVNLAHITFAMLGGYVLVTFFFSLHFPFLICLLLAFVITAIVSSVLERLLFRFFYGSDDLPQVLLTIGIIFMSTAVASYFWGAGFQRVAVPAWLSGRMDLWGFDIEVYRLFLFVVGIAIAVAMILALDYTRFGAMVRACVDNPRVAAGNGLNPQLVFAVTFAIGGGLAGLGGALSAGILGLDPNFPLRYLVYVLIVLTVGGLGSLKGTFLAAMAIGVADVAGKYYFPDLGGFAIYVFTVLLLLVRPHGLLGRAA